jgi:cytochrome c5
MSEEHETFIKTPKQLIIAIVLSFVIPILLIALLVSYVGQTERVGAGADAMSEQSVADRIRPVGNYQLANAADSASSTKVHSGEEVYAAQCAACHAAGIAGAPKMGDKDAWAPRIATGFSALLTSSLNGKGNMAAQGGGKFTDLEIARAVAHMGNSAGAEFAEPTEESIKQAPKAKAPKAEPVKAAAAKAESKPAPAKVAASAESAKVEAKNAAPASQPATTAAATAPAKTTETQPVASEDSADTAEVARVAAAAAAATAGTAATASALPTTADALIFSDADAVQQALGEGIPDRMSIFFDTGSSSVSDNDTEALKSMVEAAMSVENWNRIGLSGFTDGTGNAETNAKLAQQRMSQVRNLLVEMGIPEEKIVLVKPAEVEAAAGKSDQARRVDVYAAQ